MNKLKEIKIRKMLLALTWTAWNIFWVLTPHASKFEYWFFEIIMAIAVLASLMSLNTKEWRIKYPWIYEEKKPEETQ
jgi:hypothetical protein